MRYCFFIFFLVYAVVSYAIGLSVEDKAFYDVRIAQTEKDLQYGLMNVHNLPRNEGLLFDLREHPRSSMWMKDTYISLDMLFLDCAFYIVDIYENAEPLSLKQISSNKDFCYVLEINGGEIEEHQLTIGDKFFVEISH